MSTGLIIFARFGSSRLPGKALLPISGRAMLGRVLDRTRRVAGGHKIVIATSEDASDDPIAAFATNEGVEVFRGSLDNVAQRALDCADAFGFDRFARICGDRPFLDPQLIEQLIEIQISNDLDLATNVQTKTFPAGMATEILSTASLRRILNETSDPHDLEHVTPYYYSHPNDFSTQNLESKTPEDASLNLAIDTKRDLERANWIASQLGDETATANTGRVVSLAREWDAANE